MAFIRASQGGGGELTETTIWTNSSPTSTFPDTTITLSDSISNYKFLKIKFRKATTASDETSVMFDCDDFTEQIINTNKSVTCIAFVGTSVTYARRIGYVDDTHIHIDKNIQINGQATTTNYNIPVEIIGLK